MKPGWIAAVAALAIVAACGATPTPSPTPLPTASTTPVVARVHGSLGCAQFPYSCQVVLSVLDFGEVPDDDWRPPASDPWWGPNGDGSSASQPDTEPVGALPVLEPGDHRLVVSLLGMSDLVSYTPDGRVATDLLARCQQTATVADGMAWIDVDVSVTSTQPAAEGSSCSIDVR